MISKLTALNIFGWRLQRRVETSKWRKYLFKLFAIILALVVAGLALQAVGEEPLELGKKVLVSTFGTNFGREKFLILATPIIITAVAAALSARVGLFNMGAEGQLMIGACAATAIGLNLVGPLAVIMPLIFITAAIAAGLYALIPAWIRLKFGISEILTAIMLNYTALYIVILLASGSWYDNSVSGNFMSYRIPYELPVLSGSLHIGIIIAVALVVIITLILEYTVWGYDLKSIAGNKETARFAGIPVKRYQLLGMIISGAIAGIAGGIQVTGVSHRLMSSVSVFYGYHGLMVAILASDSMIAIIPYGLFIALLLNGGLVLQTIGLSSYTVLGIVGLILLLTVVGDAIAGYRFVRIGTTLGLPKDFADLVEFRARTKRVHDAIELKVPDRVPILPFWGILPASYAGMTYEEAMNDAERFFEANEKAILKYKPDMYYIDPLFSFPSKVMGILDVRQMKWPGHGTGSNNNYQFVEKEYMKEDEYDEFLHDPTSFLLLKFIPRIYGALEPLEGLPPTSGLLMGAYGLGGTASLLKPNVKETFEALYKAGEVANEWLEELFPFLYEMEEEGFPCINGATAVTPFDNLSMIMRGSRGAIIDMYRQPKKLHAAMEKIQMLTLPNIIDLAHDTRNPRVSVFTYRGSDGFLSPEQFDEFYWPGTKELILALIDEGLTPIVHFEGVWDNRLNYLADLPHGKIMAVFERTDLLKAKEALRGKMCFTGGMPISLIQTGTPEEVREQTRKSIEELGKDGGYIMAASTSFTSMISSENMRAWIDATKEYGVY